MNQNFPKDKFPVRSDVHELSKGILEVMHICEIHEMKAWLCYGALLGMVRDKQLLPWNNDAELGFWFDSNMNIKLKSITDHLIKSGYVVYFYSSIGALSARKKGVQICLNCFWREGDYALRPHESPSEIGSSALPMTATCWLAKLFATYTGRSSIALFKDQPMKNIVKFLLVKLIRLIPLKLRKKLMLIFYKLSHLLGGKYQKTAIYAKYFAEFDEIDFYGSTVRIPQKAEELLKFIYGIDWKIPKDSWSYYKDENKKETKIKFINERWNYSKFKII